MICMCVGKDSGKLWHFIHRHFFMIWFFKWRGGGKGIKQPFTTNLQRSIMLTPSWGSKSSISLITNWARLLTGICERLLNYGKWFLKTNGSLTSKSFTVTQKTTADSFQRCHLVLVGSILYPNLYRCILRTLCSVRKTHYSKKLFPAQFKNFLE